ncbi:pantothenate synthetase [Antricoccus suffuscus]|uniref:Pantothenate synthetase n=1 Tax=Antricoccus suffuscus TaxID=1629062 RepID=A0A2T0ZWQ6_9ACTN|nr:pantoate--beta-alanine ligase [Antricoccus suffuscus]PRZ40780.1 pantothenate synthetase [Antricoccus suffuscus]
MRTNAPVSGSLLADRSAQSANAATSSTTRVNPRPPSRRSPIIARTREELDAALRPMRTNGQTISLVPTMGALHDGHAALMAYARERSDCLAVSIFVNPTQFAPNEDFDSYPRTWDDDLAKCAQLGVDVIFAPEVDTMYPDGPGRAGITVDPGPLATVLEGATRPTHYRGVLTVVAKLFGLVRPDLAVFGEKDYQQLSLIRSMARTLCMPVEVLGAPTVREADGLAMSSRNRYLDAAERRRAVALSRALRAGVNAADEGAEAVLAAAYDVVTAADGVDLDYLELTNTDMGTPQPGAEARLLVAARVGTTRLLDNMGLSLGDAAVLVDREAR